ncbi:hypothetical protein GQ44DRAFT_734408 [Phaeosphaeriaceae sp. PMI808]|nr:hypothetical protein GQ44DRAFT_734408 [Phaeosphaeriaceae sp. PMI808]
MVFHLQLLSLMSLLMSSAYGTVDYNKCSQENEQALRNAVDDATAMAAAARDAMVSRTINGAEDVFKAAFNPMMLDSDADMVLYYFSKIASARDGTLHLKFYCNEDHVVWKKGPNGETRFWDMDFISNGNKKRRMPIESSAHPNRPTEKPGSDFSYVTGGYKYDDDWDSSFEAHIFIQQQEFGDDPIRDSRSYSEINRDGIKGNFAYMDAIRPKLAKTVFHEMAHAAGGTILILNPDPNPKVKYIPRLNVRDGERTYGWEKCFQRRLDGKSNASVADCLTFLAQAIYLQPQLTSVKKWYWSTGIVNTDNGAPWLPPPPNKRGINFMAPLTGMTWVA